MQESGATAAEEEKACGVGGGLRLAACCLQLRLGPGQSRPQLGRLKAKPVQLAQ